MVGREQKVTAADPQTPMHLRCMWQMARDLSTDPVAHISTAGTGQTAEGDWELFLHLADLHTLTPLLYACYRQQGRIDELPAWATGRMRATYDNTLSRAQWMMPEFQQLLATLSAAGIDFLVLKGFPLIDQLYGDWGARPSYDIDVWLRHSGDAASCTEALLGLGYEHLTEAADEHSEAHRHLAPLWKPGPRAAPGDYFDPRLPWTVEPHIAFWEESWWGLRLGTIADVWERHTAVAVEGERVPVLSNVDNLVYLSMHQMLHIIAGNARLIHLQDLHRLCQRLSDAEWELAWEVAQEGALEAYVAAALWLCQIIFHTPLPGLVRGAIDAALAGTRAGKWLRADAADHVLLQDWTSVHTSRLHLAWLSALFAPRWWEKARAFAQPLAKTTLPSTQFIRRRYDLRPGQWLAPYYAAHIVQGIAGYTRRGLERALTRRPARTHQGK